MKISSCLTATNNWLTLFFGLKRASLWSAVSLINLWGLPVKPVDHINRMKCHAGIKLTRALLTRWDNPNIKLDSSSIFKGLLWHLIRNLSKHASSHNCSHVTVTLLESHFFLLWLYAYFSPIGLEKNWIILKFLWQLLKAQTLNHISKAGNKWSVLHLMIPWLTVLSLDLVDDE